MRFIGLYGHGQCGKSATLNELKELLMVAGKSISMKQHPYSESPETFEYEGQIVCVAPAVDTREIVEANCRYFKQKGYDVAISATRTKGGSVDALNEFATNEGMTVEWIAKSYEYNLSQTTQIMCNKEMAEVIMKRLW
jgi:hypothetical protein